MAEVDVFKTNSFVAASDFADVLLSLSNEFFPDEIVDLLAGTQGGDQVQKFASYLENRLAEGLDANYDLTYRFYHEGGSLGLMKMLVMDVDESEIEELRKFHDGKVSAAMEIRKAELEPSSMRGKYQGQQMGFEYSGPNDYIEQQNAAPAPQAPSSGRSIMDLFD